MATGSDVQYRVSVDLDRVYLWRRRKERAGFSRSSHPGPRSSNRSCSRALANLPSEALGIHATGEES